MKKQKFVVLSVFVVAIVFACAFLIPKTQAATTVGADINTGGSLTVTGNILQGATSAIYQNDLPVFVASSTNYSVSVGTEAGKVLTNGGTRNVFLGYKSGYSVTSTDYNVGIGYQTLYNSTNNGSSAGSSNIAIGDIALTSNTVGAENVAIGDSALWRNTTGNYNTGIGSGVGIKNTTGSNNVFLGYKSGNYNVNGDYNVAVGAQSLWHIGQSMANTVVGYSAGDGDSGTRTYASSTWIGYQAGLTIQSGNSNIGLGYKAADNLTTGSNNIVIGYDIDAPAASSANTLNIGNILFGDSINGTGTTIRGRIGIATSTPWRTASEDYGFVVATTTFMTANATTTANFVIGTETTAATSTLKIKADIIGGNGSSCLEMVNVEGASYRIWIDGAGTLKTEAGTCK